RPVAPRAGLAVHLAFFPRGFALTVAIGVWLSTRWRPPDLHDGVDVDDPKVRNLALAMPLRMAWVSAIGWGIAGIMWGVIWPALTESLSLSRAIRQVIGITVIGGTITTAFTFFAVERRWRLQLLRYFP